jgi:hypothetical protein
MPPLVQKEGKAQLPINTGIGTPHPVAVKTTEGIFMDLQAMCYPEALERMGPRWDGVGVASFRWFL